MIGRDFVVRPRQSAAIFCQAALKRSYTSRNFYYNICLNLCHNSIHEMPIHGLSQYLMSNRPSECEFRDVKCQRLNTTGRGASYLTNFARLLADER